MDLDPPAKLVCLYRVSTARQGRSGLGLAAQKRIVADYARQSGAKIAAEFQEIESGRASDRPQLRAAIAKARALRAALCVAKLDRVGRRASEILTLLDLPDIRVVFADSPNAGQLQIGILAVVAQEEALAISRRTKAALKEAKASGKKLGNPNGAAALIKYQKEHGNNAGVAAGKAAADRFASDVWPEIKPLLSQGLGDRVTAERLNEAGIPTRQPSGRWHEATVRRIRLRMNKLEA